MADKLVLDAILGRETERVPVAPLVTLPHASRISKTKPFEYIFYSEKYAASQMFSRKYYDYDWVFAHQIFQGLTTEERNGIMDCGDHFILPLEIGTVFKIPKKGSPYIVDKAVKNEEDLNSLEVPDMFTDERIKPIKIMAGEEDFVCGNIRCSFTFAATYLYESEPFFMDIKRDASFVHRLMDFALKYCIESGRAQIHAGVDAMFIEDPSASPNVISPDTFRKIVLPYETKLIRALRKKVPVVFHICGDASPILDDMISTGAHCISVDECMEIGTVHKKTPVWGNVAPSLLAQGKPGAVRKVSKEITALGSGVVLSSGCVVPATAKAENLKEMVKASHES
jgi:MtaA/CmuA family methyltransferase